MRAGWSAIAGWIRTMELCQLVGQIQLSGQNPTATANSEHNNWVLHKLETTLTPHPPPAPHHPNPLHIPTCENVTKKRETAVYESNMGYLISYIYIYLYL